jgi:gas vesicle protein
LSNDFFFCPFSLPALTALPQLGPFAIVQSCNIPRKFNETSEVMMLRFRRKDPKFMGQDDYRRDSGESISTRLTYLLIGGGIGAILALLFAPKSGEELRGDIADATRKGIDRSREAAQQLSDRAGEYYEATRDRASELYAQAAEKAGEVAKTAREAAARQGGTVAAAIDAGKKAYQEEKRKTEMSGRIDAAPNYDNKAN